MVRIAKASMALTVQMQGYRPAIPPVHQAQHTGTKQFLPEPTLGMQLASKPDIVATSGLVALSYFLKLLAIVRIRTATGHALQQSCIVIWHSVLHGARACRSALQPPTLISQLQGTRNLFSCHLRVPARTWFDSSSRPWRLARRGGARCFWPRAAPSHYTKRAPWSYRWQAMADWALHVSSTALKNEWCRLKT